MAYADRQPMVVDASVVVAFSFRESAQDRAAAFLYSRALHAPSLLDYELASVALRKVRHENLSGADVAQGLIVVTDLAIQRHPSDPARLIELARRYSLTAYDAAYLALAEELGALLTTFDQRLAKAAREHLAGGDRVHDAD
jgi:predicted nucleic acid-binding protein